MKYMLTLFMEERDWSETEPRGGGPRRCRPGTSTRRGAQGRRGVRRRRGPRAERDRDHDPAGRGATLVTDGPFAETKEQLGGFYLIDVDDLDVALEWAGRCPMPGGAVEVRPVLDYDKAGGSSEHSQRRGRLVDDPVGDLDRLFRRESGRAVATLIRILGDFDLAEDAVQEAFVVALERWPRDGVPANPGAWIIRVARNGAIDRLRRERNLAEKRRMLGGAGGARAAPSEERRTPTRTPSPTTACG